MDSKIIFLSLLIGICLIIGIVIYIKSFPNPTTVSIVKTKEQMLEEQNKAEQNKAEQMFAKDLKEVGDGIQHTRILVYDEKHMLYNFAEEDLKNPRILLYKDIKNGRISSLGSFVIKTKSKIGGDIIFTNKGKGTQTVFLKSLQDAIFDNEYLTFSLN